MDKRVYSFQGKR